MGQWASYDQSFAYPPNTAMYAYPSSQYPALYMSNVDYGYYMDQEEQMRQHTYTPPQQPKGNTYGRVRHQQMRWAARDESYVRASSIRRLKAIYRHACIKMGPYGALL